DEKEKARKEAVDNEGKAIQAAQEEKRAQIAEKKAKELAEERAAKNEKIAFVLASIFVDLDPKPREKERIPLSVQLGRRLDKAAELLEGEAIGDPLVMARLQTHLGTSQVHLGYPERAVMLLTKARATLQARLGPDHPDTLHCMNGLAKAYRDTGQLDKALVLFEETLAKCKARLGADHSRTLDIMNNLATAYRDAGQVDKALPLFQETLEKSKAKLGADHPDTLTTMNNLASAHQDAGQVDKALP